MKRAKLRAMEEVFARRAERGAKGKISGLRYVAPATEAVWADWRELAAPGEREEGAPEVNRAGHLDAAEVDRARTRLERQVLRQRLALPVLLLFSPEA